MDTTANPWESAAAASSPTPGTIRGFLYKTIGVSHRILRKKSNIQPLL